jgi:hypothetical protein
MDINAMAFSVTLGTIDRHYEKHNSDNIDFLRCM